MWKLDKYACWCWTVFDNDGVRCLQSAPMIGTHGMIEPDEACDVSADAFTEEELREFVLAVSLASQEHKLVVRGWIRG
jgi:hypothetical protein